MSETNSVEACKKMIVEIQRRLIDLGSSQAESQFLALAQEMALEENITHRLKQEFLGSGPLDKFLNDPSVSEILVNGVAPIWVEREGQLQITTEHFLTDYTLDRYVRRLLSPMGRKIDRKSPLADARLADGSRVCVIGTPATMAGTHIAIRKFHKQWQNIENLLASQFITPKAKDLLGHFVKERKNILISGATGTGKTSLLNAVASYISPSERVITIEDTAELDLHHPHVVKLEARPANLEGEGSLSIRTLLRAAMRMRPDRLVLGECRGDEAADLLQAFNTGHGGSLATIHANSPRDALHRLELLALLNNENLGSQAIRSFIGSAVQILVHVERKNGQRFVSSIQELRGMENGIYLLKNHEAHC